MDQFHPKLALERAAITGADDDTHREDEMIHRERRQSESHTRAQREGLAERARQWVAGLVAGGYVVVVAKKEESESAPRDGARTELERRKFGFIVGNYNIGFHRPATCRGCEPRKC